MASNVLEEQEPQDGLSIMEKMEAQREKLKEIIIRPQFGLLAKLRSLRALTPAEKEEIETQSTTGSQNERLLNFIIRNNKHNEFLDALNTSGQKHVANWITGNGVYKDEFQLDWPLTDRETDILDTNYDFLSENLDTSHGLPGLMFSTSIINKRQMEHLESMATNSNRAEAILDILRYSSLNSYNLAVNCLRKSNQDHIAEVLENGGVVVPAHANLEGQDVGLQEEALVREMERLILQSNALPEGTDLNRVLSKLRLRIIAARQGRSIVLYICCHQTEEFQYLCKIVDSDEMRDVLEQLFNLLLQNLQTKVLLVTITDTDREKAQKSFEREALRNKDLDEHFRKLRSQLRDKELSESTVSEEGDASEEKVVTEAHSSLPEQTVEAEIEEKQAQHSESTSQEKTGSCLADAKERSQVKLTDEEIVAAIIRNNSEFFREFIKPISIIPKLASLGILTDDHRRYLRSLKNTNDKNYELLSIVRAVPVEKYHQFVECLKQANQTLVANVAEKGGVSLKVKVVHEQTENIVEIEKEIVAKLNQLQDRNSPKTEDVWRFLSQLKVGGLEILSARQERGGVVVWLWCRSQSAVEKLEDPNKSPKLRHLLSALFRLLVSSQPSIESVYLENTDVEVVNRRLCRWSAKALNVPGIDILKFSGIAILENKIFIVSQNPGKLLSFAYNKEGNATPEKEQLLKEIEAPMHMAASAKSHCLYITDHNNSSVWEVNIGEQGTLDEPRRWLSSFSDEIKSLSISRNDSVLVLRSATPNRLEIYNAGAEMEKVLHLPPQIVNPHHVAEASNGDFIVSYSAESGSSGICRITSEGQWVARLDPEFSKIEKLTREELAILSSMSERLEVFRKFNHFALDDEDQVYVCDGIRIIFLDSDLYVEKTDLAEELANPCMIHYLKDKTFLVVHGVGQNSFSVLSPNQQH